MQINRRNLRSHAVGLLSCLAACGLILLLAMPSEAQSASKKKRSTSKSTRASSSPAGVDPFGLGKVAKKRKRDELRPAVGVEGGGMMGGGGGMMGPGGGMSMAGGPGGMSGTASGPVEGLMGPAGVVDTYQRGGGGRGSSSGRYGAGMGRGGYDHNYRAVGRPNYRAVGRPTPATPWDAASVPREVVLDWAMSSTPSRDDQADLEVLLEKAFATNPQVIAAQAELQQAQAAVERARMEVARQIINTRAQWEVRRRAVQCLSDALAKTPDNDQLLQQYVDARAKLAQIEMELPFVGLSRREKAETRPYRSHDPFMAPQTPPVMGLGGGNPAVVEIIPVQQRLNVPGATPEIRKALQKKLDVNFIDCPLCEIASFISEKTGVQVIIDGVLHEEAKNDELTMCLKSVSLAAILQAFEDTVPNLCFVVRPYGILVTTRERASMLPAAQFMQPVGEIMAGPPPYRTNQTVPAGEVLPGPSYEPSGGTYNAPMENPKFRTPEKKSKKKKTSHR